MTILETLITSIAKRGINHLFIDLFYVGAYFLSCNFHALFSWDISLKQYLILLSMTHASGSLRFDRILIPHNIMLAVLDVDMDFGFLGLDSVWVSDFRVYQHPKNPKHKPENPNPNPHRTQVPFINYLWKKYYSQQTDEYFFLRQIIFVK